MVIVVLLEEWSEEERKRIHPLMIDGQDELNSTEEPNRALDGSLGRGTARPELSSKVQWFSAKIVPPKTSHGIKPLAPNLMKSSDPIDPNFESLGWSSIRCQV